MNGTAFYTDENCTNINVILRIKRNDLTTFPLVRGILIAAYAIILVLGATGNTCVVYAVWRHKSLRTVRNVFIVGLSCSDLLSAVSAVIFTPIIALVKEWHFGPVLCHAIPLLQGSALCFSTFTLTCIAIDRYLLIVHPTRESIKPRTAVMMLLTDAAVAVGISSFAAYHHSLVSFKELGICGVFCMEEWRDGLGRSLRKVYGLSMPFLTFVIPLAIIFVSYSVIIHTLHKRNKHKPGSAARNTTSRAATSVVTEATANGTLSTATRVEPAESTASAKRSERDKILLRRQRKTNTMLCLMVLIFALCWSLFMVMNFLRDIEMLPGFILEQEAFFQIIAHCIAVSSTMWNPMLYGLLNEQFRAAFAQVLSVLCCCCARTASTYKLYLRRVSGFPTGRRRRDPSDSLLRRFTTASTSNINIFSKKRRRRSLSPSLGTLKLHSQYDLEETTSRIPPDDPEQKSTVPPSPLVLSNHGSLLAPEEANGEANETTPFPVEEILL